MASTKRIELRLTVEEHHRLETIARAKGKIVPQLVRQAVEETYLQQQAYPSKEERRAALEHLLSQNIDLGTWEEAKRLIEQGKIEGLPNT